MLLRAGRRPHVHTQAGSDCRSGLSRSSLSRCSNVSIPISSAAATPVPTKSGSRTRMDSTIQIGRPRRRARCTASFRSSPAGAVLPLRQWPIAAGQSRWPARPGRTPRAPRTLSGSKAQYRAATREVERSVSCVTTRPPGRSTVACRRSTSAGSGRCHRASRSTIASNGPPGAGSWTALDELHLDQAALRGPQPSPDQRLRRVADADHRTVRSYRVGDHERRVPGPAAQIQHPHAGPDARLGEDHPRL